MKNFQNLEIFLNKTDELITYLNNPVIRNEDKRDILTKLLKSPRINVKITKQLIAAFIMVALIVGASLFIVFEIGSLWNGISVLGMASFALAIILGFGMLSNINKGDYDY